MDFIYSIFCSRKTRCEAFYNNEKEYNVHDTLDINYKITSSLPVFKARVWVKATRLQSGDNSTDSFVLSSDYTYRYQLNEFGTYRFEVSKIVLYGVYDIWGFGCRNKFSFELNVYPLPERSAFDEMVTIQNDADSTLNKGDDYSEIFELRNYMPGDDFKHIHHALSAKNDDYIVKVGCDSDDTRYLFRIANYKDFNRFEKTLSSIYYAYLNAREKNTCVFVVYHDNMEEIYSEYDIYRLCDIIYEEYRLK